MRWIICAQTLLIFVVAQAADAQQAQPPRFRGGVALVPVDVRVVDRDGNPVQDLTRDDFSIFEDGVQQTISHFETVDREMASSPTTPPALSNDPPPSTGAQRNFIIVLGRGRLQGPSKGFDALLEFVESRILPHDRLAVAVYDRLSELTTDRQAVLRLIERYRERYERIEALLDHWFRGLTMAFGSTDPPARTQARIDDLFDAPGLPAFRSLAVLAPADGIPEREREILLRSLGKADTGSDRGFIYAAAARQDLEKLHAAVEYLRYVDGEKHVILVSSEGVHVTLTSTMERLVRLAADARVTLSVIHTGGVATSWAKHGRSVIFQGPSWEQLWANANSRWMAEETGGIASIYRYASRTLDRVDRATRFQYLLGYYAQDAKTDRKYRRISVKVNRPDVTVLYRHGYYPRPDQRALDRRDAVADARIASAAAYPALVTDIPVQLSATAANRPTDSDRGVVACVRLAPNSIWFKDVASRHVASLDVAIFVADSRKRPIGELRKRVDLKLTPENHARLLREGVAFTGTVKTTGQPRYLKVVVYDYSVDRLGSALLDLRSR